MTRCTLVGLVSFGLIGVMAGCGSNTIAASRPPATSTSSTTTSGAGSGSPTTTASAYYSGRQIISLQVDGVVRTAVLVVPMDTTTPAPLVFAFHGHGGTGANFERKMDFEAKWPEAIVVYPNGLVGHKGKTDPQGLKSGWQTRPGETGDEDVAFYDAMLVDLRPKLQVDANRIYLVGHSNGSGFVSLLLNVRGGQVAATANMSGQPGRYLRTDPARSMFMSMGEQDPIVPYVNQVKSIPLAEQKIGADRSTKVKVGDLTTEKGRGGLELAVYDYQGGHEPLAAVPGLVVAFFQRHTLSGG